MTVSELIDVLREYEENGGGELPVYWREPYDEAETMPVSIAAPGLLYDTAQRVMILES